MMPTGSDSDDIVETRNGPVRIARPSRLLLLAEMRALAEIGFAGAAWPALSMAPRGDGHPVLVMPGFLADDRATEHLRAFLDDRGYAAYGWELGRNVGPTRAALAGMRERLDRLADLHGTKVSIVGWSLGGVFARELAREAPQLVRRVITLAAPFRKPQASNVEMTYRLLEAVHAQRRDLDTVFKLRRPPPVPATAIYTRSDGIVAWASCLEDEGGERENIEVVGSHLGLPHNPAALLAIADRLALAPGEWRPYKPTGWSSLFYAARSSAA